MIGTLVRRFFANISPLVIAFGLAGLAAVGSSACTNEACLVTGENCSASYKEAEYGTTDIYCCEGTCVDSSIAPGARVCR